MRKIFYIFLFLLLIQFTVFAAKPFRFALFTDLHISVSKPQNTEDLQQVITDVNADGSIDFVLISGDISDLADSASLKMTKKILTGLRMPYYITTGNHDMNESQNGSSNFLQVF
jgi:3',5'-cyclic AMP phosphodiesterase CpdA